MRRSITLLLALASMAPAFAGCGQKDGEPAKEPPKPAAPPEPPKPAAPAPAAPAPAAPAAPATSDYDAHMSRGDELAKQRKWSEALPEFELAAAAKPNDARALGSVGFAAHFAGKDARAQEASEAAVIAAGGDLDLKGSALFNLGLALEEKSPSAAAMLYATSNAMRPNANVRARLFRLMGDVPYRILSQSPDGEALLAKLNIKPVKLPSGRKPPTKLDRELLAVFEAANAEWEGAMGKLFVIFDDVVCTEVTSATPHTYACKSPPLDGKVAQALAENLVARKIAGTKQGDRIVYSVSSVSCQSRNIDAIDYGQPPADSCEVTK